MPSIAIDAHVLISYVCTALWHAEEVFGSIPTRQSNFNQLDACRTGRVSGKVQRCFLVFGLSHG
jgi:hypothetical protein